MYIIFDRQKSSLLPSDGHSVNKCGSIEASETDALGIPSRVIEYPPLHPSGKHVYLNVSQLQLQFQHIPLLPGRDFSCLSSPHPSSTAPALQRAVAATRNILAPLAHSPAYIFEEDVVIRHSAIRVAVHRHKFRLVAYTRAARACLVRDGTGQGT